MIKCMNFGLKRACIEARDAVVMEALKQYRGRGFEVSSSSAEAKKFPNNKWNEAETSCLAQLVNKIPRKWMFG